MRERSGSCHKEESTIDNHSAENAKSTRPDHEHRVVSSCRSEIKRVTIDIDNSKTASACQHDMIEPVIVLKVVGVDPIQSIAKVQ